MLMLMLPTMSRLQYMLAQNRTGYLQLSAARLGVDVLVYLVSSMHAARLSSGTGHRVTYPVVFSLFKST